MENIKIGLITGDRDYGKALGLALVDIYRNFTVTLYKSAPLHNELDRMDLVLSDTEADLKIQGKYIYLAEKKSQIDKNYDDNIYRLYKYSNVRDLTGELLFIYTNLTGRKAIPMRNSNAKIFVFGAVEGGAGCTSVAMGFAQEMSRYHRKKVMYITLEEIESTLEYAEKKENGKSVSEYLYYLFNCEDDQHFPFMESFIVTDKYGVESFVPSSGRNVLNSLNKEEMQYFISAVMDTGSYDAVVIDASNNLGKASQTCYEMANKVFIVSKNSEMKYKENRLIDYYGFLKGEKMLDKMRIVSNYCLTVNENEEDSILKTICYLPLEPESFKVCDGLREILPDGRFGHSINKLTNDVLKNVV